MTTPSHRVNRYWSSFRLRLLFFQRKCSNFMSNFQTKARELNAQDSPRTVGTPNRCALMLLTLSTVASWDGRVVVHGRWRIHRGRSVACDVGREATAAAVQWVNYTHRRRLNAAAVARTDARLVGRPRCWKDTASTDWLTALEDGPTDGRSDRPKNNGTTSTTTTRRGRALPAAGRASCAVKLMDHVARILPTNQSALPSTLPSIDTARP